MRSSLKILAIAASAIVTASASAEGLLTEHNPSMGMMQAVIAGAIEQCSKDGFKVSVVIVDGDGLVRASLRGDGTSPHTMEFARRKAYTARIRGTTSLEVMKATESGPLVVLRQIPDLVAVGGGVPIKAGIEVIGGVGVSGAPGGEKDELCANAGLAKVAEYLK